MAYLALALLVAMPEDMGPHTVGTWNAGNVQAATFSVSVKVYYPNDAGGPWKPIAVIHGGGANGDSYISLATILASHGLVVVVPTFGDLLVNPSPQHGAAVDALLDWAAAQSAQSGTPLSGRVDGSARGIAGHSNGGAAALYAAEQASLVRAIVALDAVDDTGDAVSNAGRLSGPSFHLLTVFGCGGGGPEAYANAPSPKLRATVRNSSHCDINDQSLGPLCNIACGGNPWNATSNAMFRRYTVALLACLLGDDPGAMQPWIGGASYQDDVRSGALTGVDESGLAQITCGVTSGVDGGVHPDAAMAIDAMPAVGDAASGGGASSPPAGCACSVAAQSPSSVLWLLALLLLGFADPRIHALKSGAAGQRVGSSALLVLLQAIRGRGIRRGLAAGAAGAAATAGAAAAAGRAAAANRAA